MREKRTRCHAVLFFLLWQQHCQFATGYILFLMGTACFHFWLQVWTPVFCGVPILILCSWTFESWLLDSSGPSEQTTTRTCNLRRPGRRADLRGRESRAGHREESIFWRRRRDVQLLVLCVSSDRITMTWWCHFSRWTAGAYRNSTKRRDSLSRGPNPNPYSCSLVVQSSCKCAAITICCHLSAQGHSADDALRPDFCYTYLLKVKKRVSWWQRMCLHHQKNSLTCKSDCCGRKIQHWDKKKNAGMKGMGLQLTENLTGHDHRTLENKWYYGTV